MFLPIRDLFHRGLISVIERDPKTPPPFPTPDSNTLTYFSDFGAFRIAASMPAREGTRRKIPYPKNFSDGRCCSCPQNNFGDIYVVQWGTREAPVPRWEDPVSDHSLTRQPADPAYYRLRSSIGHPRAYLSLDFRG